MNRTFRSGFTLVEIMMALAIISILAGATIATIAGMRQKDTLTRGTQLIYDDLLLIRAQAVSTAKTHRIRFTSDTSWLLEFYDTTLSTPAWVQRGGARNMPGDTNLMTGSLANAGSNLEATGRGLFQFQNNATGTPYISIESRGASQTKSLYVYTGGAVEIRTQ